MKPLLYKTNHRPADPSKIQDAYKQLDVSLSVKLHTEIQVAEFNPLYYDVFISYSHQDSEKANKFVDMFRKIAPDLKLFFDVQELKTGRVLCMSLY